MTRAFDRQRLPGCLLGLVLAAVATWTLAAQDLRLPNQSGSVKFAVIGDSGSGDKEQFEVADQMAKYHAAFKFDRVIMLGDNIYGGQKPKDLDKKFAQPYKALLDGGVKFYAALGNHDSQDNRNYPLFNMGGQRYYSYSTKNVGFFVLDTDSLDPQQVSWLDGSLKNSTDQWKIVYFHHPLYSDGATHGSDVNLRVVLEPIFLKYGVNVVFSGHDHIYERITPQKGIYYFVSGAAGELRRGDLQRSEMTAAGFDTDYSFMLVEIAGATMAFQAVSRTGTVVDAGTIPLQTRHTAAGGTRRPS
ncbi:MAG TPA: metallophosphoesterase [Vicinamibacterales bacterium]|nr:metallophosphoesterase [Vicinamibacterales bacterium]